MNIGSQNQQRDVVISANDFLSDVIEMFSGN